MGLLLQAAFIFDRDGVLKNIAIIVHDSDRTTTADYALEHIEAVGRLLGWLTEGVEVPPR